MRILIIDSSLILYQQAQRRDSPHILKGFMDKLGELVDRLEGQYVVLGNDISKSRYRNSLSKEYKAHRKDIKKSKKQQDRENEVRKIREYLPKLFKNVLCDGSVLGVEFDDVASLLYKDFKDQHDIIIVSSDKDLLQLGAKQWCPKENKFLEIPHGLSPKQWTQYKMLVADKSDGLKGLVGCGDSYSTKILQTYGSIQEALKYTDPDPRINKLLDLMRGDGGMGQLKMSYRLVKLFTDYKNMNDSEIKQYEKIKQEVSKGIVKSFQATEDIEDLFSQLGYYKGIWQLEMITYQLLINRGE